VNTLDQLSPYVRLAHIFRPQAGFSLGARRINDYALLYFKRGEGRFLIGKTFFPIAPGALFVLPPDLVHSFALTGTQPALMLNLHFDPVYQAGCEKIHFSRRPSAANPRRNLKHLPTGGESPVQLPLRMEIHGHATYERLFFTVERHWRLPDPASRLMVKSTMIELLSLLFRQVQAVSVSALLSRQLPRLERATQFMRERIDRPLSMSEVARHAGFSRSHFSTCFGAYYGMSPAKFHLRQRIEMAAIDLIFSRDSIKAIAEKFGFQTIHHFTRCFAQAMDLPPAAYREAHGKQMEKPAGL
jgi:AraC-like DNA-binding protein